MYRGLVMPLGAENRLCGILFSQMRNRYVLLCGDGPCSFAVCFFADEKSLSWYFFNTCVRISATFAVIYFTTPIILNRVYTQ